MSEKTLCTINSTQKHNVAIVGATGSAGAKVAQLLMKHPNMNVQHLMAGTSADTLFLNHHPEIHQLHNHIVAQTDVELLKLSDIIFLALPHGKSAELTKQLENVEFSGIIVDLGADRRLERECDWQQFYQCDGEDVETFCQPYTYGLPELRVRADRQIPFEFTTRQRELLKATRRIAVPGCNVTAVTLGLQPALLADVLDWEDLNVVLANGYSGAGRTLATHLLAVEAFETAKPYAVGGVHRHIPEIRQNIVKIAGLTNFNDVKISFTPTLVPMNCGILATITAKLTKQLSENGVREIYQQFCNTEPFLELLPSGVNPSTHAVNNTNYAQLQVWVDTLAGGQFGRLVVVIAIDNLVRGTAGQAIQSLNLALGLDETVGLL